MTITFHPASHILGSAMIHLATPAGGILFTGDYCVGAQNTVPALPRPAASVDIAVSESTYGNRLHANRSTAEERLLGQIREVLDGGGRVLIPAFAIGRAQEILLILKRGFRRGKLPEVPVFVDGMVRTVCDVYRRHERFVSRSLAHSIRRDDERPSLLWVLGPDECDLFPDEAALAEKMKKENPKGRLLELCMRLGIDAPEVTCETSGAFHVVRMTLQVVDVLLDSGPQKAVSRKTAEHAAARSILEILSRHPNTETPAGETADDHTDILSDERAMRPGSDEVDAGSADHSPVDPRKLLNESRQAGVIHDFGYTLHEQRGPSHMPIFVMTGWALIRKEERIETAPVEAGSKKTAQREAASALVARLSRLGLLADSQTE